MMHALETYLNEHVFQQTKECIVAKVERTTDTFIISLDEKEEE